MRKPKAIALYSGGLDSALAILVMMRHGVQVEAIRFSTPFICNIYDSSSDDSDSYLSAKQLSFPIKVHRLGKKFVEIVKHPRHGYGKNLNPCIDCRLLMLREAKDYMEMTGADFIITGEVLGQRPMSQMRNTINLIDKKCGLGGRLVRPLSGKLFEPTLPEKEGLIKRDWLLDINGRSRKRQMQLADEFGLKEYTNPAGGCYLTDSIYCKKLKDLMMHTKNFDFNDINLLTAGRQFRLSENCKLVVGRDEKENDNLVSLIKDDDMIIEVLDVGSPIAALRGEVQVEDIELAAAIAARYSDAKYKDSVMVNVLDIAGSCISDKDNSSHSQSEFISSAAEQRDISRRRSYDITVKPADADTVDSVRI